VLVVEPVRKREVPLIPTPPVVGLVTADEDNRVPSRIEREQRTQVSADRSKLLHVVMSRALDRIDERSAELWSLTLELIDRGGYPLGILLVECHVPLFGLGGQLDLPGHITIMMYTLLSVKHYRERRSLWTCHVPTTHDPSGDVGVLRRRRCGASAVRRTRS